MSGESFLDFSQNINPLGPPNGALTVARRAISSSTTYPESGYPDLRRAFAEYLNVDESWILPTNGGAEALFLAALSLARSGARRAVILEPTFSEYAAAARAAGMEVVRRIGWRETGGGFVLDHGALRELGARDVIFLCNPNNPTGGALSLREALDVVEAAREVEATVVVDEAFADFAPEVSLVSEAGEGLLVARSFTKFFAIPGLRLGCLVSPGATRYATMQPSWSVNVAAEAAGISVARDHDFARRSLEVVSELRSRLYAGLSNILELRVYEGTANFLLARGPMGIPERLARRGVLVRGCEPFCGLGSEYFRVAVRGEENNRRLVGALRDELTEGS